MSLRYKSQDPLVLVGAKTVAGVTTGIALTTAYQTEGANKPTKSLTTGGYARAVFNVLYTMGATETANSVEVKIEESSDGINWFSIANDAASGGTSTLTAREFKFVGADAASASISIFLDIAYKYVRVSAKETGVVTNAGNVYIEAVLSGL